jgi:hypothetical protein
MVFLSSSHDNNTEWVQITYSHAPPYSSFTFILLSGYQISSLVRYTSYVVTSYVTERDPVLSIQPFSFSRYQHNKPFPTIQHVLIIK